MAGWMPVRCPHHAPLLSWPQVSSRQWGFEKSQPQLRPFPVCSHLNEGGRKAVGQRKMQGHLSIKPHQDKRTHWKSFQYAVAREAKCRPGSIVKLRFKYASTDILITKILAPNPSLERGARVARWVVLGCLLTTVCQCVGLWKCNLSPSWATWRYFGMLWFGGRLIFSLLQCQFSYDKTVGRSTSGENTFLLRIWKASSFLSQASHISLAAYQSWRRKNYLISILDDPQNKIMRCILSLPAAERLNKTPNPPPA